MTGYLAEYSGRVAGLLFQPSFYIRWALLLDNIVYLGLAALGLVGVALFPTRGRGLLLGMWVGYGVYGISLSYPIMTHNYYMATPASQALPCSSLADGWLPAIPLSTYFVLWPRARPFAMPSS